MRDAWRAYLELALGLTEASRKKAEQTARSLVGKGGATAAQLQAMAEDLFTAGTANRESLTRLVRVEVDRALDAVGLAKADEVAALRERIRRLEGDVEQARARTAAATAAAATAEAALPAAEPSAPAAAAPPAPATGQAVASQAVAGQAVAKKAVAKKAVAKKAVAKKAVVKEPGSGSAGGR